MNLSRKLTDFILLEDGRIGQKAALFTGTMLASATLGAVLVQTVHAANCHCNHHDNWCPGCTNCDYWMEGTHTDAHDNRSGPCPLPC